MKKIYLLLSFSVFFIALSQNKGLNFTKCKVSFSKGSSVMYAIDANQLQCLSENSDKQLLVYVFEWWCKPCNEKIEKVREFADINNMELLVLTLEKEKNFKKDETLLTDKYKIHNIAVLKDTYGKTMRKKYWRFLTEIYGAEKFTDDLSKLIIYGRSGNIKYISKWQDGDNVLQEKILPLLE